MPQSGQRTVPQQIRSGALLAGFCQILVQCIISWRVFVRRSRNDPSNAARWRSGLQPFQQPVTAFL